jgi:hypothetical protein
MEEKSGNNLLKFRKVSLSHNSEYEDGCLLFFNTSREVDGGKKTPLKHLQYSVYTTQQARKKSCLFNLWAL